MTDWKVESAVVQAAVADWEPFLFSNEIYWPIQFSSSTIPAGTVLPRLSAGRLLLAGAILSALIKSGEAGADQYYDDLNRFLSLKTLWLANWQKKVKKELPSRIRQWQQTIQELKHAEKISPAQFSSQLSVRVIVTLLLDEVSQNEVAADYFSLIPLDQALKNHFIAGDFVLEKTLEPLFPKEKFWFLYGKIA
ncbi:MAG: hypothetical protein CVU39_06460 [Chloroflexi bacterium HGW-Chloroflexi-10]|nr:MAG: hypothetical protein CVU39_06460 [Chloroflexi bacterium HGW-Chloroflexi-10]